MAKAKKVGSMKPSARKRTLNAPGKAASGGAPFNDQDAKRRLGQFEGAGEHSLVGSRNKGIVGHHDHNKGGRKSKKA